jgi:uncharacterized membrane protein
VVNSVVGHLFGAGKYLDVITFTLYLYIKMNCSTKITVPWANGSFFHVTLRVEYFSCLTCTSLGEGISEEGLRYFIAKLL